MSYLKQHGSRSTPQSEKMRGDQVENSAGGFTWAVDEWTRLRRFLILGSEGGSYYASERDLTKENVEVVRQLASDPETGPELVAEIVRVSHAGLAPKNDPALFALACAISLGDKNTKKAAAEALPKVARIATHLYHFVAFAETMRGWGRTMRWAVKNWYAQNPEQLAFQAVKYQQRDGWSHRDLLRLAHPEVEDASTKAVFDWIAHGTMPEGEVGTSIIDGFVRAQSATSPDVTAQLVEQYRLPREALRSEHLTSPAVWEALLDNGMPIHALTRNLANMTRIGVLDGTYKKLVYDALRDQEAIRKARLHPLAVLLALSTYAQGRGYRGSNTWQPIPSIVDALDEAFYLAFDNVVATGKRILLALDISGSMDSGSVAGSPLTPRAAAAAMAMVTVAAEADVDVVTFSCAGVPGGWYSNQKSRWGGMGIRDGLEPFAMSKRQRLDDVVAKTHRLPMGGTDCALPMLYAIDQSRKYDAFVIYTDSETWAGSIHPMQALNEYRNRLGIPAKLVTVGMVSNGFTIADPNDADSMDVVGFDSSAPAVISEFIAGRL